MEDLKKICSKRLRELKGNLSAQDKLDAMAELEISRVTLDKYLQGKPAKIERATKLIKFLEGRIKENFNELEVA